MAWQVLFVVCMVMWGGISLATPEMSKGAHIVEEEGESCSLTDWPLFHPDCHCICGEPDTPILLQEEEKATPGEESTEPPRRGGVRPPTPKMVYGTGEPPQPPVRDPRFYTSDWVEISHGNWVRRGWRPGDDTDPEQHCNCSEVASTQTRKEEQPPLQCQPAEKPFYPESPEKPLPLGIVGVGGPVPKCETTEIVEDKLEKFATCGQLLHCRMCQLAAAKFKTFQAFPCGYCDSLKDDYQHNPKSLRCLAMQLELQIHDGEVGAALGSAVALTGVQGKEIYVPECNDPSKYYDGFMGNDFYSQICQVNYAEWSDFDKTLECEFCKGVVQAWQQQQFQGMATGSPCDRFLAEPGQPQTIEQQVNFLRCDARRLEVEDALQQATHHLKNSLSDPHLPCKFCTQLYGCKCDFCCKRPVLPPPIPVNKCCVCKDLAHFWKWRSQHGDDYPCRENICSDYYKDNILARLACEQEVLPIAQMHCDDIKTMGGEWCSLRFDACQWPNTQHKPCPCPCGSDQQQPILPGISPLTPLDPSFGSQVLQSGVAPCDCMERDIPAPSPQAYVAPLPEPSPAPSTLPEPVALPPPPCPSSCPCPKPCKKCPCWKGCVKSEDTQCDGGRCANGRSHSVDIHFATSGSDSCCGSEDVEGCSSCSCDDCCSDEHQDSFSRNGVTELWVKGNRKVSHS